MQSSAIHPYCRTLPRISKQVVFSVTIEKSEAIGSGKAVLAVLLGNIFWGFSYLFNCIGQRYALPTQVLAHRFTTAFILINLLLLSGKEKLCLRGKKLRPLFLLCLCELSCFFFESYGIYYTNATISGIFQAAAPIATMALSSIFLKEPPTRAQALFCLLPIAGVIMISLAGRSLGTATTLGLFLLMMFCLSSGAYKAANRGAGREFTPFERTYALLGSCMVVFTAVSLAQLGGDLTAYFEPLRHLPFTASVLALSLFASIAGNMLINYSASRMSATKVAIFGAVCTVVATFTGIVFLHEPVNAWILIGAVLILVGIWQVTIRGK